MKRTQVFGLITAILLASCGGSDGFKSDSSTATTTTSAGTTTTATGIMIGSGTGSSFVEGTLAIGITGTLSAGGTTSVTATLVTAASAPYTDSVDVTFTSSCAATQLATIESNGSSTVATSNGSATATYTALGCSGADTITASATVGGTLLSATGTITVGAATLGAIQFISASPTTIALKGTGGAGLQETSTVTFKVTNSTGGPVPSQSVTFSLSTSVGGIALTPTSGTGTTGADGKVSVIVQAGSIATPVRVFATVTSTTISTQSDQLTVTTGIPVDGGVAVSVSTFNPEAYNRDGVEVTVSSQVMDRFNNPVPNGTVVNFRAEAGRIQGACTTTDGACDVTWTSQSQQLANDKDGIAAAAGGTDADGAVTILAYVVGEERFNDENGNGVFDGSDTKTDIGEAFLDTNADGDRDTAEPYIDFNVGGTFNSVGDGKFNGVLCAHATDCSTTSSVIVSDSALFVMSSSTASISFSPSTTLTVQAGGGDSTTVTITDANGNIMPAGTAIEITGPSGVQITSDASYTVPDKYLINDAGSATHNGTRFDIDVTDVSASLPNNGATPPVVSLGTGRIQVKVTTPAGAETTGSIDITY